MLARMRLGHDSSESSWGGMKHAIKGQGGCQSTRSTRKRMQGLSPRPLAGTKQQEQARPEQAARQ